MEQSAYIGAARTILHLIQNFPEQSQIQRHDRVTGEQNKKDYGDPFWILDSDACCLLISQNVNVPLGYLNTEISFISKHAMMSDENMVHKILKKKVI